MSFPFFTADEVVPGKFNGNNVEHIAPLSINPYAISAYRPEITEMPDGTKVDRVRIWLNATNCSPLLNIAFQELESVLQKLGRDND